jgi:hypothetical protein
MRVRLTKDLKAVPPGRVHPKVFPAGEIVEGRLAEVAIEQGVGAKIDVDTDGDHAALAAGAAAGLTIQPPPANDPTPLTKARVASPYSGPDHTGEPVKIAEGVTVEGEIAEFLIAQGVALEVQPEKKPAASKAKGKAPENK